MSLTKIKQPSIKPTYAYRAPASEHTYAIKKATYGVISKEQDPGWRDGLEKYKNEKWLNMTLADKKV